MLIQQVVQRLKQMGKIHKELNLLARKKKDVLIKGSPNELQQILIEENKRIHQLEHHEQKRQEEVKQWFQQEQLKVKIEEQTITRMLEHMNDEEDQKELLDATIYLTEQITEFKQHEQLNRELIAQSMQFVHMSLEFMYPSVTQRNYDRKSEQVVENRSVFDSEV